MKKDVAIALIPRAQRLNYRELKPAFVNELAEEFEEHGYNDYPVEVVYDAELDKYWLWDGNHRIAGAEKAGCPTITISEQPGTKEDAKRLLATESNKLQDEYNLVRVTSGAKLLRAEQALLAKFTAEMTLEEVAEATRVSIGTVREAKARLKKRGKKTSKEYRAIHRENAVFKHFWRNPDDDVKPIAEAHGMRRADVAEIKKQAVDIKPRFFKRFNAMVRDLFVDAVLGDPSRVQAYIRALEVLGAKQDAWRDDPDPEGGCPLEIPLPKKRSAAIAERLEDDEFRQEIERAVEDKLAEFNIVFPQQK